MEAILNFVRDNPGTSRGKIAAYLGLAPTKATAALRALVRGGRLTMTGAKKGARYSVPAV